MTYSLHRLAEHDLASAFQFYRDTGSGTYPLKKFPYSMIYKSVDSGVRILVIRHQRREAEYGDERA